MARRARRRIRRRPRRPTKRMRTRVKRNTKIIKKLVRENRRRFSYQMQVTDSSIGDYYERNLISPANWGPRFNTIGAGALGANPPVPVVQGPRAYLQSVFCRCTISMEASGTLEEGRPVDYAIYFVTLRKANARQTLKRTGALSNLTKNTDYTAQHMINEIPAMWDLNPEVYNVKAVRRGTVGVYSSLESGQGVGNIRDNRQRHVFSIPHKRTLTNGGVYNPDPSWKSTKSEEVEAHDRMYIMLFHNAAQGQEIGFAAKFEFKGYVPV